MRFRPGGFVNMQKISSRHPTLFRDFGIFSNGIRILISNGISTMMNMKWKEWQHGWLKKGWW